MASRYAQAFNLIEKLPHGAIQDEPSEAELGKLFANVWPRCEKVLTTERSRFRFLRCIAFRSGLTYDWRDDGIMIFEPGHQPQGSEVIASEQQTMSADGEYEDVL